MQSDDDTRQLFAGKLEILKKIGAGGMAQVFLARRAGKSSQSLDDYVVVKMIRPGLTADRRIVQHFLDEARVLAMLRHENIVEVLDVGSVDGMPFIAMEYLHGQNLRSLTSMARKRRGTLALDVALDIVARAALGLHDAHTKRGPDGKPLGIVHRDVSPHNIVVTYDGRVKVIDFGIAKAASSRREATMVGVVKGKLRYLAPEQALSKPVDARADVFALGVVLYEMTTMRRAFPQDRDEAVLLAVSTANVAKPSALVPDYPPALEAVVMKALAADADARFENAAAFVAAIDDVAAKLGTRRASKDELARYVRDLFKTEIDKSATGPSASAATAIKANPWARPESSEESSQEQSDSKERATELARPVETIEVEEDTFVLDGDTAFGWSWIAEDPRPTPAAIVSPTTDATSTFITDTPELKSHTPTTRIRRSPLGLMAAVAAAFVLVVALLIVLVSQPNERDERPPIAKASHAPVDPAPVDVAPVALVDAGVDAVIEPSAIEATPATRKHRAQKPLPALADDATPAQAVAWLDANCRARVACAAEVVLRKKTLATADLATVRAFPDQIARCVRQCRTPPR